jgi:branched-chain amino acid transport system ATP-binding protein
MLEILGVSRRFGGLMANRDVTFSLAEGEILGLIGPNGAGKTTLFNMVAGALRPTSGEIRFLGQDITGIGPSACCEHGIARTFQVVKNFESMTVLENVMVGAFMRTGRVHVARSVADDVLSWTKLDPRRDDLASELTPPEKRRLEVARALATQPKLLLLDEVFAGLTPSEAREGVELVRQIRKRGIAVLIVEHVMEVLMPVVDRVVVLALGEVLAEGAPADIVRNPEVITAYLGERYHARRH